MQIAAVKQHKISTKKTTQFETPLLFACDVAVNIRRSKMKTLSVHYEIQM